MTLAWSCADFVIGIANILNTKQITAQGAYVGLYCAFFVAATIFNLFGLKASSYLNKFVLVWVGIGTILIIVAVPAMAPTHQSAKWVFTEFINRTGYTNKGMAFLLGLLQSGWTLVGYECGAQIVEGTKKADITAPRGIIICVLGAIIQGFALILITLFSIQDVDSILDSAMPVATFFIQATRNSGLCVFFLVIMLVAQFSSLCNSMLATVHIFWALSRDRCFPYSGVIYQLNEKTRVPVNALILQLVISISLIMPVFGSEVYWQAIMSAAVICINVSYGLPLLCRLFGVRDEMPKGPFSLGKLSIPLNIISIVWVCFFSVILCIPSVSPVTAETMNWASVMICGIMGFSIIFWLISGRKNYTGPVENSTD
ncbi:amino acid/polyamine transporter I [Mycotypha africana]|uniref:amino acid/polyamine transporter I n=1 Tax=Mycotypha africana TaxID=64632 RepID=UPI002301338F|nr:amino acid/polyamine transporter I [Mycotypha africana]KAI8975131.1 amino acid/polyamine transporter I [Mycotypha africana]